MHLHLHNNSVGITNSKQFIIKGKQQLHKINIYNVKQEFQTKGILNKSRSQNSAVAGSDFGKIIYFFLYDSVRYL